MVWAQSADVRRISRNKPFANGPPSTDCERYRQGVAFLDANSLLLPRNYCSLSLDITGGCRITKIRYGVLLASTVAFSSVASTRDYPTDPGAYVIETNDA